MKEFKENLSSLCINMSAIMAFYTMYKLVSGGHTATSYTIIYIQNVLCMIGIVLTDVIPIKWKKILCFILLFSTMMGFTINPLEKFYNW